MNDYPTDEELKAIKEWQGKDGREFLALVKESWWMPDWGWTESEDESNYIYHVSTGGWSGNEELISTMQENFMGWHLSGWESTRRGGHYVFLIRKKQ